MSTPTTSPSEPEFDQFADDYEDILKNTLSPTGEDSSYFAEQRIAFLKSLNLLPHPAGARILDFGCGTGGAFPFFKENFPGAELFGVDPSQASVDIANQRAAETGARSFVPEALAAEKGSFDLAHCNGVFHHIPPAERPAAFKFVYDHLKPGGLFAFYENNPWNPATKWLMSRCEFDKDAVTITPNQAKGLLWAHGFAVIKMRTLFYFPKSLGALRFTEPALGHLPLGGQYLILARK